MNQNSNSMDIQAENWLKRIEQNSTDKTPSKLQGFASGISQSTACELLTATYGSAMKKRGVSAELDDATRTRLTKISKWLVKHDCPGLLLYGYCGIGKTTMLKSLFDVLNIGRGYDKVIFITASDIYDYIKNEDMQGRYKQLESVPVLLIDDIGCEPERCLVYGTHREPIRDLLLTRYDRLLITVVTTNLDDAKIKDRYGERVSDRLGEVFDKLTFTGTSYRNRR